MEAFTFQALMDGLMNKEWGDILSTLSKEVRKPEFKEGATDLLTKTKNYFKKGVLKDPKVTKTLKEAYEKKKAYLPFEITGS